MDHISEVDSVCDGYWNVTNNIAVLFTHSGIWFHLCSCNKREDEREKTKEREREIVREIERERHRERVMEIEEGACRKNSYVENESNYIEYFMTL